jgi:SAM-dependent methyltransferase
VYCEAERELLGGLVAEGDKSILDVGTGAGKAALYLALELKRLGRGGLVTTIDRDPAREAPFIRTAAEAGLGTYVQFVNARAERFLAEPAPFDIICDYFSLPRIVKRPSPLDLFRNHLSLPRAVADRAWEFREHRLGGASLGGTLLVRRLRKVLRLYGGALRPAGRMAIAGICDGRSDDERLAELGLDLFRVPRVPPALVLQAARSVGLRVLESKEVVYAEFHDEDDLARRFFEDDLARRQRPCGHRPRRQERVRRLLRAARELGLPPRTRYRAYRLLLAAPPVSDF